MHPQALVKRKAHSKLLENFGVSDGFRTRSLLSHSQALYP